MSTEPTTSDMDIEALVQGFSRDLDQLDDSWNELADGGGGFDGGGGGDDHGGGGGGGGGGDGDGSGDDGFDEDKFYEELSEKLTKKLSKEDQEAVIQSMGIAIDRLPFNLHGHAVRMFNFSGGHLMRRTTPKSRTGEWIMYRPDTGTWGTEAADDLIIDRALQVAFVLQRWAQQMSQMIADSESGKGKQMSDAKAMVLGALAMMLLVEAEMIQKSKIPGIIRIGRSIEKHHINYKRFDADPMKLAVGNGVIDLRTGELLAPSPANYITRHLGTCYVPLAKSPAWDRFLEQAIPDPLVRNWVQRFAGYTLTGDVEEQVAAFFYGTGGSGKSTLWKIIRMILGTEFASQVHRGVFHKDDFTRYASSTIVGLRLGVDSEWENAEILMTGKFRQLVGETTHTPEPKMQKLLGEVPITAKFVFLAQHLPYWDATDVETAEAMRRRMFLVPMNQKLARGAYTSRAYLDLTANLMAEQEGILAWLVEGERLRRTQPLHVDEPQAMQDARDEYFKALGAVVIDEIAEALAAAGFRLDQSLTTLAADLNAAMPRANMATALGIWLRKHGCTGTKVSGARAWKGIGR